MRILVNGCSHIEGTGLADRYQITKKMTWPNLVWDCHDVNNIAFPGSSNDRICRTTLEEINQNHYDFVCVQWSYFERIELQVPFKSKYGIKDSWKCIQGQNAVNRVNTIENSDFIYEVSKSVFLKQFDKDWFLNYNLAQIVVLQTYLQQKKIPYIFTIADWPVDLNWKYPQASIIDKNQIFETSWVDFCKKNKFPMVDSAHYDVEAHIEFSELIKAYLKVKELV